MQQLVAWPASVSTRALASQKVLNFLRPSDTQFIRKKILITAGIIWRLKLKTKITEVWVCGITNTNFKQINYLSILAYFIGRGRSWTIITKWLVYMWYSPLKHERFSLKKSFSQQFRRRVTRLPIFMGKSRDWTIKKTSANNLVLWQTLRTSKVKNPKTCQKMGIWTTLRNLHSFLDKNQ